MHQTPSPMLQSRWNDPQIKRKIWLVSPIDNMKELARMRSSNRDTSNHNLCKRIIAVKRLRPRKMRTFSALQTKISNGTNSIWHKAKNNQCNHMIKHPSKCKIINKNLQVVTTISKNNQDHGTLLVTLAQILLGNSKISQ